MTIDQLAQAIADAIEVHHATSDRRHIPDMHTTIVRVLTEFVDAHELDMMRLRNAHDIDKEKIKHLEHQIAELEVRNG